MKKGFGSKSKVPSITGNRTGGTFGTTKKALGTKVLVGPLASRPGKSR